MEYQLIRSARRKTVALQVKNAQVFVRAPNFVDVEYIDKLIQLKLPWLEKKIAQQVQQFAENFPLDLSSHHSFADAVIYVDGVPHKVNICFGRQKVLHDVLEKTLYVFIAPRFKQYEMDDITVVKKVNSQIEQWFKKSIVDYLCHQLPLHSEKTLLHAKSFKVRKYRARWGSCNSRGELSFNYLLKMVPPWVVDYVIVHELCHLKHMNHSTKFWQLVEQHYSDFQSAKNWLKKNQASLSWN